jgi:hypothetical protein
MGDCDVHMQNSCRPWKAFSWFLDLGPHPSGYKDICGPFSCPVLHQDLLGVIWPDNIYCFHGNSFKFLSIALYSYFTINLSGLPSHAEISRKLY